MQSLNNKHIVVTGAGRGIGAAIVDAFADKNVRLSLMGRTEQALAEKAQGLSRAEAICVDIADSASVSAAFASARRHFGPVDVLINNAGAVSTQPFHKLSDSQWLDMVNVNLNGVFYCAREVIGDMREQGWGRVVNIASTAALTGYRYVSAYCAAKHGVVGLTRALALEVAKKNITVNAVCPGYTDTDIIQQSIRKIVDTTGRTPEDALHEFTKTNPQGRLIQPKEVADTVLWLCSAGAVSITGQAIAVAGGEVM